MEINRTTDYAIRVVMDLASGEISARVRSADIARRQGIPLDYLSKVLVALSRAGIVATRAGRAGGVRLLRPAGALTVLDVIEAMEGPLTLNRCLSRRGECPRDRYCPAHKFLAGAQRQFAKLLSAATIADLVTQGRRAEKRTKATKARKADPVRKENRLWT